MMSCKRKTLILILGSLVLPGMALAHTGNAQGGILPGLLHPLSGWDHLLMALIAGTWLGSVGKIGMKHSLAVFLLPLMAGMLLGANGVQGLSMELLLAASVGVAAVMLLPGLKISTSLGIALVGSFALLHGLAHGNEIIALTLQGSLTALAVSLTTGLVLWAGHTLGMALSRKARVHK